MTNVPAVRTDFAGPTRDEMCAVGFLARYREPTRSNYGLCLRQWFQWCDDRAVKPLAAKRIHIELYARELEEVRNLGVRTIAGKLNVVCNFYKYATIEEEIPSNPATWVKRPSVPRYSSTVSLTRSELLTILDLAQQSSPQDHALVCLLGLNGLRVGEATAINVEDLSKQGGQPVVRVVREKSKLEQVIPMSPRTSHSVEQITRGRDSGPLLMHRGEVRMDRAGAGRVVTRLVKAAGITKRITPHSFRHTFCTLGLDAGVSVRDMQNSLGHADARYVSYYDRAKDSIPRNATHFVSAYVEGS